MKQHYKFIKTRFLAFFVMFILNTTVFGQVPGQLTGLVVKATGTDNTYVIWTSLEKVTGYKVDFSKDSVIWKNYSTVADTVRIAHLVDLEENSLYNIRVTPFNTSGNGGAAIVKTTTAKKGLVVDIPFDKLINGKGIRNNADSVSVDSMLVGQVEIVDAATSGLGKPAIKFVQDELSSITSYARLYKTLVPISGALTQRTINFWVKNNQPTLWSVPLSIEKRTGMGIAFKDGKIFAFTKHRTGYPAGIDWMADSISAPYTSSEWTMVTYVFDNPKTKLYLNGTLAGESDGIYKTSASTYIPLPFPTAYQTSATGDKSAEIGALLDPDAGMQTYIGDNWDPGARRYFDGMMSQLKMYNYALSDAEIKAMAVPNVTGVIVKATGINDAVLLWNLAEGATGYKVVYSKDSVTWMDGATAEGTERVATIKNLEENTKYFIKVMATNMAGEGNGTTVTITTVKKGLVVDIPFDQLVNGKGIRNNADSASVDSMIVGQVEIVDAATSGLGKPAIKFTQDELSSITSYARLYKTLVPISGGLTQRTISFWVKNNQPTLWSVPLSIEKRTGMGIAFKDGQIFAFTKHRTGYPAGVDWMADSISAPYTSSEWTMVTYVFDNPKTKLYLNGTLEGESDGIYKTSASTYIPLPFPTAYQTSASGDKSAEIGALLDPDAGMQTYIGDNWDPGARRYFDGMMSQLKMYNYALSDAEIKAMAVPNVTGVIVKATGANDAVLLWNLAEGATGYKVVYSKDSVTWMDGAAAEGTERVATIKNLEENTKYFIKVMATNMAGEGNGTTVTITTVKKGLVVDIPFDQLVNGKGIRNNADSASVDSMLVGQVEIVDAATSGLGKPAIKFTQDELSSITSYARLYKTLVPISGGLTQRTISFWVKNNQPTLWSVPLSIEKRTGMGIAFKDGQIFAFTKHRTGYPAGVDWMADSISTPYTSSEWTMVTYVFDNPKTKLYLNGTLAGESDGIYKTSASTYIPLPFPTAYQTSASGDKSAEIGALLDPDAGMQTYLGDTWDPGARRYFDGMMSQLKMYNYALSNQEIGALFGAIGTKLEGLIAVAKSPTSIQVKWTDLGSETGYKVAYSSNGTDFKETAVLPANTIACNVSGLQPEMNYQIKVSPIVEGPVSPGIISDVTLKPEMKVHLDFKELVNGTSIQNVVDGALDSRLMGDIQVSSIPENEYVTINDSIFTLGNINQIIFKQDELNGINSYTWLYKSVLAGCGAFTQRSVSFWVKNNNPQAYTVPVSFEKRSGFSIAFKEGKIFAFTRHRPRYPQNVDWVADSISAPFNSTGWTQVTYVFDFPVTRLYINGVLAGESDGKYRISENNNTLIDLPFATNIGITEGGDKSAEMGAQLDPDAATVSYLGDTWDPGARNYFDGSIADFRMYNYALSIVEITDMLKSALTFDRLVGVKNLQSEALRIYPNPVRDVLHFEGMINATVSIFNNRGQLVLVEKLKNSSQLNVNSLNEGMYIIKVITSEKSYVSKFIKFN